MQSTHALYDPCALCAPVRFFRRTRSETWPRRRRTCASGARRTTAVIATANRFRPSVAEIPYSLYGRKKSKKESKRNSDDKSENHVVVTSSSSPNVKRICLMHQNIIYRVRFTSSTHGVFRSCCCVDYLFLSHRLYITLYNNTHTHTACSDRARRHVSAMTH